MSNITDHSHFVRSIALPSLDTTGPEHSLLEDYITQYETEYLQRIFGQTFYTQFIDGIDSLNAIYLDIRDGKEYTDIFGRVQKWDGFVSGTNPIANYVFCKYVRDESISLRGVGATVSAVENGTRVSPQFKLLPAWNAMVKWNKKLHDFLYANMETYPDYVGLVYPPDYASEYLMDNQLLFKYQNSFGI